MPIDVSCPDCSKRFRVPDTVGGKRIACKHCGGAIPVPNAPVQKVTVVDAIEVVPATTKLRPKPTAKPPQKSTPKSRPRRRPSSSRRPARPRKARRQEAYDDFDEYEDPYDDSLQYGDLGEYGSSGRQKSALPKGREKWVRIALLILAIACCVRTASFGCEFIVKVIGATKATQNIDLILGLLKADVWLHLLAFAGMIAGYIFLVMGPDRSGSQLWGIGSLVMGLIGFVLFFILRVLPLIDDTTNSGLSNLTIGSLSQSIPSNSPTFSLPGSTFSLWNLVFRHWVLVGVYLSHMLLAVAYVKSFFHSSKKANTKQIGGQCQIALVLLLAHAGLIILQGLLVILLVEVIVPSAYESAQKAMENYRMNGGERPDISPPSKIWGYMVQGLDWAAMVAFLAFMIIALRIYFGSWSKAAK